MVCIRWSAGFIYEARDYTIDPTGRNDELILQANFRVAIEAIKSERKWGGGNALRDDSSEINRIVVRNYGEHRQSTRSFFPFAPTLRYIIIPVILHRVMELSRPFDPFYFDK